MGLGFLVKADIPKRGLLRQTPSQNKLFSDISRAIRRFTTDPLQARMITADVQEHTLSITLHPCAEPVRFLWEPDQAIEASAKTSTLGPGYHAYVVELLNRVGTALGLRWDWAEEEADETEFANEGDFGLLQDRMASLLRVLGRILLENAADGYSNLMVDMPMGYPAPQADDFAIAPRGPLSESWCRSLAVADGEDLRRVSQEYYLWWERAADAEYWRKTGLSLLSCEVWWHVPRSEGERATCQLTLDCLARAAELDQRAPLPTAEINELRHLLSQPADAPARVPSTSGIGYRRHQMVHHLAGQWTIQVPGYYYQTWEDDDGETVFWFGGRTVRFSSLTLSSEDGRLATPEDLLGEKTPEELCGAEVVDLDKGPLRGWATIRLNTDDGQPYWILQGKVACGNCLGIVTVCFEDAADREWAVETYRSTFHPEPEEQDASEQA